MPILVTGATGNVGRAGRRPPAGGRPARHSRARPRTPRRRSCRPRSRWSRATSVGSRRCRPRSTASIACTWRRSPRPRRRRCARRGGRVADRRLSGPPESGGAACAAAVEQSGVSWTHPRLVEFRPTRWTGPSRSAPPDVRDGYPLRERTDRARGHRTRCAATSWSRTATLGQAYELTVRRRSPAPRWSVHRSRARPRHPVRRAHPPGSRRAARAGMGEYASWYVDGIAQLVEHPQRPQCGSSESSRDAREPRSPSRARGAVGELPLTKSGLYACDPLRGGARPLVVAPVFNTEVARDAGQAGSIPVRLRFAMLGHDGGGSPWRRPIERPIDRRSADLGRPGWAARHRPCSPAELAEAIARLGRDVVKRAVHRAQRARTLPATSAAAVHRGGCPAKICRSVRGSSGA